MSAQTVVMEGVTPSQPGVCVSYTTGGGAGVRLSVFRAYDNLPNSWGGRGVHKHCDGHGLVFDTQEQASAFCLSRGYIRPWVSSLRAKRKLEARDPRVSRRGPTWAEVCAA